MRCWLIAIAVNQLIGYPETLNLPISLATVLRRRTFDKKSVPKPTHGNSGIALCCLRTDVGILRQIKAFKQKCPVRPPPKFDIRRHHAQRPTQRRASSFEHSISVSSRKYGILLQPLHYNQTDRWLLGKPLQIYTCWNFVRFWCRQKTDASIFGSKRQDALSKKVDSYFFSKSGLQTLC